jgi:hypothetical protein
MITASSDQHALWKSLVLEQQKSGLSIADFCRVKDLRFNQFYYYKALNLPKKSQPKTKSPGFVEAVPAKVKIQEPIQRIVISLGEISISLEGDQDINLVAELCLKLAEKR